MSRMSPGFVVLAALTFLGAAALVLAAAAPRAVAASGPLFTTFPCPSNPAFECVMKDLDNPRGLAFFPIDDDRDDDDRDDAILYVAEAGRGGLDDLANAPCFTGQGSPTPLNRCYGRTGAITRLWKGSQRRIVSGLPSHANRAGQQAQGAHDIAFLARRRGDHRARGTDPFPDCEPGCAYVAIGLMQPPRFREEKVDKDGNRFLKDFAKVARVSARDKWDYVADLGAYQTKHDPDQDLYPPDRRKLDTNPYGLIADPRSRALVAIDAGGNSMLRVGPSGNISTLAAFAPHADDSVPTSVAVGPDGAYYVGELTGIPLATGAANIYRVGRHGGSPDVCLTGFTAIIDIAFDKRGNLYVLQDATIFTPAPPREGTVIRVVPDRSHNGDLCAHYAAGDRTSVVPGLEQPTSVAVGPDGALYISNRGTFPATGEVIRFVPPLPPGACSTHADCDDGNVCTQDKCDKKTGTCEFKPHDNGHHRGSAIACDDGNACTSVDVCDRGICQGSNLPDGTVCSDGNACTQSDTCESGACTGANPVICSPSDQCHVAGTCNTATGSCSNPTASDGTACDDTETCSGQDVCQAGACSVPGVLVEQIAFASNRHNPAGVPPVNSFEIYLMNPDGTNVVRLTDNVFSDAFAALSPDGKGRIVFDSNRNNVSGDPVNLVDLWLMRSDGSNQQYLVRGSSASWSPDSQSIAFQRSASGTGLPTNPLPGAPAADSDIFVARVCDLRAGVPPTNVTNDLTKVDADPDWSSDGQKIVFTKSNVGEDPQTSTSSEIWVMNPDGSGLAQLTLDAVDERGPAWSPDGTRITYSCKQGTVAPDSDLEVCVMNADGTGQTQLTFNTTNDAAPVFSPDGQKIVWNRGGGGGTGNHIWVMNPDGTGQTQITAPPGTNFFPDWGFVRR